VEPVYLRQYSDYATAWTTGLPFPAGEGIFFRHRVQTGSGALSDSCPIGTGRGVKLITSVLRIHGAVPPLHICLQGDVLS